GRRQCCDRKANTRECAPDGHQRTKPKQTRFHTTDHLWPLGCGVLLTRSAEAYRDKAQLRFRRAQVAGPLNHTSYAGHPRERRGLSRWLQRLVRRFHLCTGEKPVDSDRALPTGVCLLSISRPPGKMSQDRRATLLS